MPVDWETTNKTRRTPHRHEGAKMRTLHQNHREFITRLIGILTAKRLLRLVTVYKISQLEGSCASRPAYDFTQKECVPVLVDSKQIPQGPELGRQPRRTASHRVPDVWCTR